MKIIFIGCVEGSYRLLNNLIIHGIRPIGIITKKESEFNSDFCDLAPLCIENGLDYIYVEDINDDRTVSFITSHSPEIGFCFGWSQLLNPRVLDLFPQGVIGYHPSALPLNRGRHPLIWALVLGLTETASTFFKMDSGADTGQVVSQEKVEITYEDDATTLYQKVNDLALAQELKIVEGLKRGNLAIKKQDLTMGNNWRKRGYQDGVIDWKMTSRAIYNLVRALTHPYVGASFMHQGKEYKVWKCREKEAVGLENIEFGKVLAVNTDGTIDIKVYDGVIQLVEFDSIQLSPGEYLV